MSTASTTAMKAGLIALSLIGPAFILSTMGTLDLEPILGTMLDVIKGPVLDFIPG